METFTLYQIAFRVSCLAWTLTKQKWKKSLTRIENRAGVIGREGLVNQFSLLIICFRHSRFQCPLPTYSLPLGSEYLFTLHQSEALFLFDIWRSTLEISAAQLLSVTEIAPFVRVNRIPIRYGFRAGARAIRCRVNTPTQRRDLHSHLVGVDVS